MKKQLYITFFISIFLITIVLPHPLVLSHDTEHADWTVLFYFDGDQKNTTYSLAEKMLADVENLKMIGSTDQVHFVVLMDLDGMNDTSLFYVLENQTIDLELSQINSSWSNELNLGDGQVLTEFLSWGVLAYPAHNYNLYLNNHGGGWYGICADEHPQYDILNVTEVTQSCARGSEIIGKRIDVVSMDACLMMMVEVLYDLSPYVHYVVGSEAFIHTRETRTGLLLNWHVDKIYGHLVDNPWLSAQDLCLISMHYFQSDRTYVLFPSIVKPQAVDCISTVDCTKVEPVVTYLDTLARMLMRRPVLYRFILPSVFFHAQSFSGGYDIVGINYYPPIIDVYDIAVKLREHTRSLRVQLTARKLMQAVDDAVIYNRYGSFEVLGQHPDAHGISVYWPIYQKTYDSTYQTLSFAQDTQWDEFLRHRWRFRNT